jgi:hypothetical protein
MEFVIFIKNIILNTHNNLLVQRQYHCFTIVEVCTHVSKSKIYKIKNSVDDFFN